MPKKRINDYFYGRVDKFSPIKHPILDALERKTQLELLKEDYNNKRTEYSNLRKEKGYWDKETLEKETEYSLAGERLAEATLDKYPKLPYIGNFTNRGIQGNTQFLIQNHVRPDDNAKDVIDYYNSYLKSEGLERINKNQLDSLIDEDLTKFKILREQENLAYHRNIRSKYRPKVFTLTGYPEVSSYSPAYNTGFVYKHENDYDDRKDEHPYITTLAHEIGHHWDIQNTPNRKALDINKGFKENQHDEYYHERMADLWSLRYLLYNKGIYDSRGKENVTPEQINKLREEYPNIRIFKQMKSNDDVAKMLNLVAYNNTNEKRNIAKNGGIINIVNNSRANFVSRLKDPNRRSIKDWQDSTKIATHKLGVGTDNEGNHYVYPEVQEINGKLIDFTRPPYLPTAGRISAEQRGDTVRIKSLEDALEFTQNYKKYYPNFDEEDEFKRGGKIRIKPSHRGRLTRLKARTGKSESELYNDGNPAHRKMVVFARNARKWKH